MAAQKNKSEVETELKIKLSPEDLERVFKSLSKKNGASRVSHKFLPRMYYDTASLDFYKNNLSLRVQYKAGEKGHLGGYEQTVKVELTQDAALGKGVLLRKECKNSVKSHKPELASVVDPAARAALKPFLRKKLAHIFTAAIERRFFEWKLKDGKKHGVVEVAFDIGKIILPHSNRHQDFSEIEVEIKSGSGEFIEIVKNKILNMAPSAKIQPLSKSDQGSRFHLKHKK
ncbi:MAG: CYTH domain-containing protein [Alphaproteobacteria bacterium]|nr:CYTH domain-containing protein [Alphaproteobacteria bacterium]